MGWYGLYSVRADVVSACCWQTESTRCHIASADREDSIMEQIASTVARLPGMAVYKYALLYVTAGGHNSVQYGYAAAYRAVRHGLVRARPCPRRQGVTLLYPMD